MNTNQKAQKVKGEEKRYTLDEAYAEITRIKTEMGMNDWATRKEKEAFQKGYAKACDDLQEDFIKRSSLLRTIYGKF